MTWELDFIRWLQSNDLTALNYVFYVITQLGTELFFMIAVMILYWCVNKKEAYRLVNLFMLSQITVGVVKTLVKRVRPYYYDGVMPIIEQTSGYSFPSGHSNNIAVITTFGHMLSSREGKWKRQSLIVLVVVTIFVMFSRVYLGQHFPTDVIVGALLGVGVGVVGFVLFDKLGNDEEKLIYGILPLCACLAIASIVFYLKKGEELDALMTIAGTYSATAIGYFIEKRYVNFEVNADKKWKYAVRLFFGAIVVLALKVGLKKLFGFADGVWSLIFKFIRYFIIGAFVTVVAPLLFKKFNV